MNSIPAEYISPAIALYCMVEQVVANDEKKPLPSELESIRLKNNELTNGLSNEISQHFRNVVSNLALDEQEKAVRCIFLILPNPIFS
jgi:hypothetical protein